MNDVNIQEKTINAGGQQGPKKNPYTLWFVVLSFVAPAALAYAMYFFGDIQSFSNHGDILDPIVHIDTFELKDVDGNPIPTEDLTYKWRMISFLSRDCDKSCQDRLIEGRQLYTLLGKNRHRVMRMFVHLEQPDEELKRFIEEQHPNVIQVYGDKTTIVNSLGAGSSITDNEIYMMDPMGNVMMRFDQKLPPGEILYDIRKLLKASMIG